MAEMPAVNFCLTKPDSMKKGNIIFSTLFLVFLIITGFSTTPTVVEVKEEKVVIAAPDSTEAIKEIVKEEVKAIEKEEKVTLYKSDVLATYYADKFNGRKTTSGARFNNKKYTAAHMKLPFGTKVRITNEKNGKFVDVVVNDRGPFSKKLEIDLTKQAFMEIASNKGSGSFKVKMEIIE
jgi:rare lipoprotein A